MGDVTVRVAGRRGFVDYINELDSASREIFYQAIDEIGEVGANEMRRIIRTRTSRHSRSGLKAKLGFSSKGRIRTGAMLDSIGHRPRRGNKLYQAEVGYLKNYQDYFKYQEIGFRNVWKFVGESLRPYATAPNAPAGWLFRKVGSGEAKTVTGLFALRDARQKMEEATERIMDRAATRIDRRARRK